MTQQVWATLHRREQRFGHVPEAPSVSARSTAMVIAALMPDTLIYKIKSAHTPAWSDGQSDGSCGLGRLKQTWLSITLIVPLTQM